MTDRPINLRRHEVHGILAGRQTQMRRPMRPQPLLDDKGLLWWHWSKHAGSASNVMRGEPSETWLEHCPYGKLRDQLWGQESFSLFYDGRADLHFIEYRHGTRVLTPDCDRVVSLIERADWPDEPEEGDDLRATRWYSPICMPRSASRITLEITDLRVERVQDISEADAVAEGITDSFPEEVECNSSRPFGEGYAWLWEQTNGRNSWDTNPFVWVIGFRRVDA